LHRIIIAMKKMYIQPNVETMIIPAEALMGDNIALAGSGDGPADPNLAPRHVAPPVPGDGL